MRMWGREVDGVVESRKWVLGMGGGKWEKLLVGKLGSRGAGVVGRWGGGGGREVVGEMGKRGGVGGEVLVGGRWKLGVWWSR